MFLRHAHKNFNKVVPTRYAWGGPSPTTLAILHANMFVEFLRFQASESPAAIDVHTSLYQAGFSRCPRCLVNFGYRGSHVPLLVTLVCLAVCCFLTQDDRELIARLRPFARFHSPAEHDELIENLLLAKRMRYRRFPLSCGLLCNGDFEAHRRDASAVRDWKDVQSACISFFQSGRRALLDRFKN